MTCPLLPAPPPTAESPLRLLARPGLESIRWIPPANWEPLAALRIVSSSSGVGGRGRPGPFRCCNSLKGFGTGSLTWRVPSFWRTSSSSSSSSLLSSSSTIGGGCGCALKIRPFCPTAPALIWGEGPPPSWLGTRCRSPAPRWSRAPRWLRGLEASSLSCNNAITKMTSLLELPLQNFFPLNETPVS